MRHYLEGNLVESRPALDSEAEILKLKAELTQRESKLHVEIEQFKQDRELREAEWAKKMQTENEVWEASMKENKAKQEKELEEIRTDTMAEISKLSAELQVGIASLKQEKEIMTVYKVQQESGVVTLEVGGTIFKTTITTLTTKANSMLAAMFSGRHEVHTNAAGAVFIDRDPTHFALILNYLRGGQLPSSLPILTLEALQNEADYYQLHDLAGLVAHRLSELGRS